MSGYLITFEGIDGAGKSSHIGAIGEVLQRAGRTVTTTREPGGTPLAEKLRTMILNDAMDPMTEALMVFAARRDHIQQVIRPALENGHVVLCDRFTDSTFAYQGHGRGFSHDILATLEGWVLADLKPNMTLLYDLEPAVAARRLAGARAPDRFESEQASFFNKVRAGYLQRAAVDPDRFVILDADKPKDLVWADLMGQVEKILGLPSTFNELYLQRSFEGCV